MIISAQGSLAAHFLKHRQKNYHLIIIDILCATIEH